MMSNYPRLPRALICNAAVRPPLFMWNRYDRIIGAALRIRGTRYLSIQWRRP